MKEKDKLKQERPPEFLELEKKFGFNAIKSNLTRSRSLVIGTTFNGCYEVGMRTDDGTYHYVIVMPHDIEFVQKMFSLFPNTQCPENSGN